MSILNQTNCGNDTNMGVSNCQINLSFITRAIAMPIGTVIPATALVDNTTFNAYINDKLIADNRNERFYLINPLLEINDKTGDPVTESRNNTDFIVTSKPYNWGWFVNESICDYKNLRSLFQYSQNRFTFLFGDSLQNTWGVSAPDEDGEEGLAGYNMAQVYIPDWTPMTSKALVKFMFTLIFANNEQLISQSAFVQSNYIPNTTGLVDVKLTAGTTTSTATNLYVTGKYGCSGSNLSFFDQLADPDAWTIVPTAGGSAIVPSAVVLLPDGQFKLTITSTPGASLTVGLAAPSVLAATPFFVNLITERSNKAIITTP